MDQFCRTESLDAGEPVAGSAAGQTDVWLALEYDAPWGPKAVADARLPDAVTSHLLAVPSLVPGARVQLIRRASKLEARESITLFVGVSSLVRPAMVRFELPSYEALLELNLPQIVVALRSGVAVQGATPLDKPLVLVCTNGKRDRCCAKWGLPIYADLADRDEVECWQTTHLGGHRFAPTLLTLPDGLCYGRLGCEDLDGLVAAMTAGEVFDPGRTLRGRTCLSGAGQAAEVAWRVETGEFKVAALQTVQEVPQEAGVLVTLGEASGTTYTVTVEKRTLEAVAHPSCAKAAGPVSGWFASEVGLSR